MTTNSHLGLECDECGAQVVPGLWKVGDDCRHCPGHMRVPSRPARDGETLSDEPFSCPRHGTEYARDCIYCGDQWIDHELAALRAECAAKDDEMKRRATEADTWFVRSRAHEQAADALRAECATIAAHRDAALAQLKRLSDENESVRAECARLTAEREEIDRACETGMRLRLPAEQIVARIRAARAAAPTPRETTDV